MHPKQHSILQRMGVYCKHFALGFALICAQLTLSSASAQTSEPSAETFRYTKALLEQADSAYNKGDFQQAIRDYTQAIALNPNNAGLYGLRGLAYYDVKDYSSAIRDFNQAIALNPNDAYAYGNRGVIYSKLKDYSSAIRDLTQSIALGRNDANVYYNRAASFADKKDYRSATRDARKACSLGDCRALEFLGNNGWLRD